MSLLTKRTIKAKWADHFFKHKSNWLFMKEWFALHEKEINFLRVGFAPFWRENWKLDLYHTFCLCSGLGIRSFAVCSFTLNALHSLALVALSSFALSALFRSHRSSRFCSHCSPHSFKNSDESDSLSFLFTKRTKSANLSLKKSKRVAHFFKFFVKNERFAQETKEQIPNLAKCLPSFQQNCRNSYGINYTILIHWTDPHGSGPLEQVGRQVQRNRFHGAGAQLLPLGKSLPSLSLSLLRFRRTKSD